MKCKAESGMRGCGVRSRGNEEVERGSLIDSKENVNFTHSIISTASKQISAWQFLRGA